MNIADAITKLRAANMPVPKPMRLPTADELAAAESSLGLRFHPDYRRFLVEASDVATGTHEPFDLTTPESPTALVPCVRHAWAYGVPTSVLPFCEDNGNYFCLTPDGKVVYWDHNGKSDESWADLATWIAEVWLGEA